MKFIKHYNEGYNMTEKITDIREFFSNLKLITYHFEDYHIFNKFKNDIEKELNTTCGMSFFGFTINGRFFDPIIDTVTVELHKMFDIIVNNDYQGIYDGCNERKFGGNRFEYYERNTKYYLYLENHISKVISSNVNDDRFTPYYDIRFRTRIFTNSDKIEEEKETKIINDIIDKYNLKEKYEILIDSSGSRREIRIIRKNRIILNSKQKKEIEKAKLFGLHKYEELKERIPGQIQHNDLIDSIIKNKNKFNL